MANLYTGALEFDGYKTVTELTGVSFTEGNTYTIQISNSAYIREGELGAGFLVSDNKPFQYIASSEDLYIRRLAPQGVIVINIAE